MIFCTLVSSSMARIFNAFKVFFSSRKEVFFLLLMFVAESPVLSLPMIIHFHNDVIIS